MNNQAFLLQICMKTSIPFNQENRWLRRHGSMKETASISGKTVQVLWLVVLTYHGKLAIIRAKILVLLYYTSHSVKVPQGISWSHTLTKRHK